jgi:hypothetical protein
MTSERFIYIFSLVDVFNGTNVDPSLIYKKMNKSNESMKDTIYKLIVK